MKQQAHPMRKPEKELFLYGIHPVTQALQNPNRQITELLIVPGCFDTHSFSRTPPIRFVQREELDKLVGPESVHQGVVARCRPLKQKGIEEILARARQMDQALVIVLDQVTDPHNVGAILRSGVAFNALAVITLETGAPNETGVLAKSASGALDLIPLIKVSNLIQVLTKLKEAGFWCIGMDGNASQTLCEDKLPKKCAFIMGSEGHGLRRLTQKNCDYMTKLPMNPIIDSLNVSVATALALYEWHRQHG